MSPGAEGRPTVKSIQDYSAHLGSGFKNVYFDVAIYPAYEGTDNHLNIFKRILENFSINEDALYFPKNFQMPGRTLSLSDDVELNTFFAISGENGAVTLKYDIDEKAKVLKFYRTMIGLITNNRISLYPEDYLLNIFIHLYKPVKKDGNLIYSEVVKLIDAFPRGYNDTDFSIDGETSGEITVDLQYRDFQIFNTVDYYKDRIKTDLKNRIGNIFDNDAQPENNEDLKNKVKTMLESENQNIYNNEDLKTKVKNILESDVDTSNIGNPFNEFENIISGGLFSRIKDNIGI